MTDVFLYQGEVTPSDVKLRDPTTSSSAPSGITARLNVSQTGDSVISSAVVDVAAGATVTQSDNTLASAAAVAINASGVNTQVGNTVLARAAVGIAVGANISQSGNTVVSGAAVGVAAVLNASQASNSLVSGGTIGGGISASLIASQAGDTITSGAQVGISGSVSVSQADNAISASASVVTVSVSVPSGGGSRRKLRILPDGTRMYLTEREVRQILSMFYQPKQVEKLTPKLRVKNLPVDVELIKFDKHVPKVYELKQVYRRGPDYQNFLKSMRVREEEEFFSMILEAL